MRRHNFVRRGGKQEPHLHRYIELQTGQQSTGSHRGEPERRIERGERGGFFAMEDVFQPALVHGCREFPAVPDGTGRSAEHTSELQSLMRSSYAVFCLKKKTQ